MIRCMGFAMLAVSMLPGCQSVPPASAAFAPQSCDLTAPAMALRDLDPASVSSLVSLGQRWGDRLRVEYAKEISGPCAGAITHAQGDMVRLADGSVHRILPSGVVERWPAGQGAFRPDATAGGAVPGVTGARFIAADEYTNLGGSRRYVGLWERHGRWTVAAFAPGTDPRPLFHSRFPIAGLTYFPSPDTAAGQLWIVQKEPHAAVRVIVLRWVHERMGN